jgi:hypothetical protein
MTHRADAGIGPKRKPLRNERLSFLVSIMNITDRFAVPFASHFHHLPHHG